MSKVSGDFVKRSKASGVPPRHNEEIARLLDDAGHSDRFDVRRELAVMAKKAMDAEDAALESTTRCEYYVWAIFEDEDSLNRFANDLCDYLHQTDITYLRTRAEQTNSATARARYLHAVALLTNRQDDGQAAVEAAIDALRKAREGQNADARGDAFNTLVDMYPLAFILARRFRAMPQLLDEALAFLTSSDTVFVHAKTRVFCRIIDRVTISDEYAKQLREPSLSLLYDSRGGDHGATVSLAAAGRRLADRLREPHAPWLQAEATALESKLQYNQHPMLVQMISVRLLRIHQLLHDEERARATIERSRAASAQMEYTTVTVELEGAAEHEELYRSHARSLYRQLGPLGALAWLASNNLVPSVTQVQRTIDDLAERGIGSFRQIATTIISADERVIAQNPRDHEFDEQYDVAWTLAVKTNAIFLEEFIAAGLTLSDIEELLRYSWFAADEDTEAAHEPVTPNDLVELLRPGLRLYLSAFGGDDELKVPALDSLVLRCESMLRKLARLTGIPHVRATDREGRPLIEHADLRLLDHERMASVAGEDLVAYARHTLARSPEGLRDRIGHGVLHRFDYRLVDLHALFLLYLRFAALSASGGDGEDST